jgi:hypothetical protein
MGNLGQVGSSLAMAGTVLILFGTAPMALGGEMLITPSADGTIVDGGAIGPFDGQPDQADWTFNESGYDGLITRVVTASSGLEHRLVFEYDLRNVNFAEPVTAALTFTLRGSTRFPAAPAPVAVHAFTGDLVESMSDFHAGPVTTAAILYVPAFQPTTTYTINVSSIVNARLRDSAMAVAFRFQIQPYSSESADQAFMDAIDADEKTKPLLLLTDRIPGDFTGDGLVDLADALFFSECMRGPGRSVGIACRVCDLDYDADVDLRDFLTYEVEQVQDRR